MFPSVFLQTSLVHVNSAWRSSSMVLQRQQSSGRFCSAIFGKRRSRSQHFHWRADREGWGTTLALQNPHATLLFMNNILGSWTHGSEWQTWTVSSDDHELPVPRNKRSELHLYGSHQPAARCELFHILLAALQNKSFLQVSPLKGLSPTSAWLSLLTALLAINL